MLIKTLQKQGIRDLTNVDYYLNLEFTSKSDNNVSIEKVVINTKMLIKTLKFKAY
ncbi:hypothetical protein U3516DRAFT_753973 [Neocallimastix sp. 'constans']